MKKRVPGACSGPLLSTSRDRTPRLCRFDRGNMDADLVCARDPGLLFIMADSAPALMGGANAQPGRGGGRGRGGNGGGVNAPNGAQGGAGGRRGARGGMRRSRGE
jgi:hypothetical protein